jgi:saxitoxin biosynthesis operon SxtJ-like protein
MEIDRNPSRRDLLWFGAGLPVATLVAGLVARERLGTAVAARVWVVGAAVTVLYAVVPAVRRPVFVGWMRLTYPVGWVVTKLLLLVAFLVVMTPIGILLRALQGDPLERRADASASTYWAGRTPVRNVQRYFQRS